MAVILFQSSFTELKELKWFLSEKKKIRMDKQFNKKSVFGMCVSYNWYKEHWVSSGEIVRTPIKEHWQNEGNKKDNEATEIKWSTS